MKKFLFIFYFIFVIFLTLIFLPTDAFAAYPKLVTKIVKGFETIEKYTDIDELTFTRKDLVLLECVSNLCANEMFSGRTDKNIAADKIISGIEKINKVVSQLIVVTNEIFSDGILYEKETIEYMKVLGEINRRIFECADNVIESVYGIPYILKGNLT